ncbi:hypothetical protein OIU79_009183 [Salix purpurea]|uniref:Uncharacterized protein n=1 Tax=Salix purpurea TaxID=77065 RepID=A0A9Q0TK49_SALPP|nr:hypothetical protein OIU79_009183 [Salix purpurea]
MGVFAAVGVLLPFPYYYWLWTNPQAWVNLCGKYKNPSKFPLSLGLLLSTSGPSLALVSSSTSGQAITVLFISNLFIYACKD